MRRSWTPPTTHTPLLDTLRTSSVEFAPSPVGKGSPCFRYTIFPYLFIPRWSPSGTNLAAFVRVISRKTNLPPIILRLHPPPPQTSTTPCTRREHDSTFTYQHHLISPSPALLHCIPSNNPPPHRFSTPPTPRADGRIRTTSAKRV